VIAIIRSRGILYRKIIVVWILEKGRRPVLNSCVGATVEYFNTGIKV
jgi:hypothetical protein